MNARVRRSVVVVMTWVVLLSAGDAAARRVPSVGGKVVLALPDAILEETVAAHTHIPLIERVRTRSARDALASPALPRRPEWKSDVLQDLVASKDLQVWTLTGHGPATVIGNAVGRCFGLENRGLAGLDRWPARVLEATSTTVLIEVVQRQVKVRFSRPFGPVPEMLEGCQLSASSGIYSRSGRRQVDAREGHILGPPAMRRIELRKLGEPADLVAGSPIATGVGTLLAPFPDVLMLLQAKQLRDKDPLDLLEDEGALKAFRSELRPDLLVTIFWAGRGGPALGILPPGLAPARPLPAPTAPGRPMALTLGALSSAAERIAVVRDAGDGLAEGIVERIAVLLRTRGFGTEPLSPGDVPAKDALRIVRWRPPTADPALALLVLAGRQPTILADVMPASFEALLSADLETRLEAAIDLERLWMEARAVVPLLVAERWFALHPDLHGVAIRPDGVPLLDRAYWGGAQ